MSLEELVLRQALGQDVTDLRRDERAAAVMMIPIPERGVYEAVEGLDDARRLWASREITIRHGPQTLVPLPEGSRYLGFIFRARKRLRALRPRYERRTGGCARIGERLGYEMDPRRHAPGMTAAYGGRSFSRA